MSLLETVSLEHVPSTHSVHVAFFRGVANAGHLQSQLLARNADFEYAFIDATTVISRLQVLAAAYKALSVLLEGRLKSPNVHAETVLALSASNNISEAYRRYGIDPEVKDIIVVKVLFPTDDRPQPPTADDIWRHLSESVEGTAVPFTDEEIAKSTDWSKVSKYYKLNGTPALKNIKDEKERLRETEMLVLSSMALRGV
ncbi:protein CGI121 [Diaporthe sp. PMI_573]|nr:protein CGI121 [Diaporthaceae sp. PMI_573]